MSEAPAFLQLQTLTDAEEQTRLKLLSQLSQARKANLRQEAYYEGARKVRDLGISIPPHLRDVEAVAAGPQIVVDVVDERMDWRGWSADEDLALDDVYDQNHLEIEVGQATLDSLICGLAYLTVGTGDDDEPEVLVKAESPSRMTATWDSRRRRAVDGLCEMFDSRNRLTGWQMYVPGETITAERKGGRLVVTDRDEHGNDRVPIAVLINKPRASRMGGRSEITRHIRSITDSHMRTLLGMEIAREFYGAPQRYLMGADESMFVDENGNPVGQWAALIGRMLMAPRDDEDQLPVAGQFASSSPQPFTELLKTYMQEISASSGIPATHFGFATDNPASADAIQRADVRLDKRAVRRQKNYNLGLVELGELVCLWRDGELPEPGSIRSLWTPVSLTAPGAAADRAVKMISAGVLDPTWDFTLEQFGLDDDEILRVNQERLRNAGRSNMANLAAAADAARADQQVADLSQTNATPAAS
ncbi:MAG: phage portal protein [Sphingomonadales bacterium]|nr:phage portal protein [Sphingomonadales bacterium]